jgi:hypothetical protein
MTETADENFRQSPFSSNNEIINDFANTTPKFKIPRTSESGTAKAKSASNSALVNAIFEEIVF